MSDCDPDQKIAYLQHATVDYDRALANDPRAEWFWLQGTIYQRLGTNFAEQGETEQARLSHEAAARSYLSAIQQDATYGEPRDYLRDVYSRLGRTDIDALDDILAAMGKKDTAEDLLWLAKDELGRGKFGLAVVALDRALTVEPQSQSTALLKAQAYQLWGERYPTSENAPKRYQESAAAYAKAVTLGVGNEKTLAALGAVAYLAGDYAQSATAWGQAIIVNSAEPRYYFKQGLAYIALGDVGAAQQSYTAGIAAAKALPGDTRNTQLVNALADLRTITADPAALAVQWIEVLAREQNQ